MNSDDVEVLSLVDKDDVVIGAVLRGEINNIKPQGTQYIRAVNAFLVREDNRIWVPTRGLHKKLAPGGLDYSVGAHVQAGEEYTDALIREFLEEAGITISLDECVEIAYNTPESMGEDTIYFNKVYIIRSTEQPILSEEHSGGEFMDIDEIIKRVQDGAITKHHFLEDLLVVKNYLRNAERTLRAEKVVG